MERITPTLISEYLTCPQWVWLDRFGDLTQRVDFTPIERCILEQTVPNDSALVAEYTNGAPLTTIDYPFVEQEVSETKKAMERGDEFIYHAHLRDRHFESRPTLLVKRVGKSNLGDWFYQPIDAKSAHEIADNHKYALTLHALLLEGIQLFRPERAGIITIDNAFEDFSISNFETKFYDALDEIQKILTGDRPLLTLSKASLNSPWGDALIREAEQLDDIALIYKIDRRAVANLHKHGINTVEDARTMNIDKLDTVIPFLKRNGLERMKLQAESLKSGEWFLRRSPKIPTNSVEIYFDIEGDPLSGVEYLFGFLIFDVEKNTEKIHRFTAERPEKESDLWREFLDWLPQLPEQFSVFHYSGYEKSRLSFLARKYASAMSESDEKNLEHFSKQMFDLNEIVKEDFIFPVYFYGLKQICKFLGFAWDSVDAGGVQSIIWYEEWLRAGNRDIFETIVRYNEDDVRATKFLKEWLVEHAT